MFLHFKFLTFVLFLTSLKFVIFCYFFKFLRNVRIFFDTMRLSCFHAASNKRWREWRKNLLPERCRQVVCELQRGTGKEGGTRFMIAMRITREIRKPSVNINSPCLRNEAPRFPLFVTLSTTLVSFFSSSKKRKCAPVNGRLFVPLFSNYSSRLRALRKRSFKQTSG